MGCLGFFVDVGLQVVVFHVCCCVFFHCRDAGSVCGFVVLVAVFVPVIRVFALLDAVPLRIPRADGTTTFPTLGRLAVLSSILVRGGFRLVLLGARLVAALGVG